MNTTWSTYKIILITLKIITLFAIGKLHIYYMMSAIHPQSVITFVVIMLLLISIVYSLDKK